MATINATITAPVGPGNTVSSLVLNSSRKVVYDAEREVFSVTDENGVIHNFDWETIATITHTISGDVSTLTITT